MRNGSVAPWNRTDDHHAHYKVEDRDDQHREPNGPGNILLGIFDFASEVGARFGADKGRTAAILKRFGKF